MSMAVEHDGTTGRSVYSMCTVNPSKVQGRFDEDSLHSVDRAISRQSGWLFEVANYNVADMQYICAGHVRALAALTEVLKLGGRWGVELHR